ncbi:helix-turn-helix domain-containing protein [Mailhella sp.]|uniref:helix-turn-helix domain-containing protein n=1 Tax=Mailhella sp. TaxID=1981029 RepID=UPI0040628FA7
MKSTFTKRYEWFCEVLVNARRSKGLTQVQVAAALGTPQSYVSKYESGERRLDVVEFIAVAAALNEDPLELLRQIIS